MTIAEGLIAYRGRDAYFRPMVVAVRLLTLFALLLMPVTMTAAPAEAHAMPEMMAGEHCGDHSQPTQPATPDMAQCMLMCAALPAAEPLRLSPPLVPKAPRRQALANPIHGIIVEIATPPPRAA